MLFNEPDTPMSSPERLTLGQALLRWILYVFAFILFGGLAAGGSALFFEYIIGGEYIHQLYAVVFAVSGYIAYQLLRSVLHSQASSLEA